MQSPTFVIARTHPSLVGGAPLVHVDAYRLGSALELDDLDIDVDGSVVVVEWGRGMVDGLRDAWWEIELERPLGGRGADTACGDPSRADAELDADAPRTVSVTGGRSDIGCSSCGGRSVTRASARTPERSPLGSADYPGG